MTGEKNRFKTLDKMANLNDKQLTTPKHDEMVLWLLNKNNALSIFDKEIGKTETELIQITNGLTNKLYKYKKEDDSDKIRYFTAEIGFYLDEMTIKLISEAPVVSSYNKFIIGYWDLVIQLEYRTEERLKKLKRIHNNGRQPHPIKNIYVEIKPKIESFGETLRQLRTYQEYIPDFEKENIYLFTGDDNFKDAFESQGIKVILASDVM